MDIRSQYADLLPEIKEAVGDVIDSGRFILGPHVRGLEEELAASVGARPRGRRRQRHRRAACWPWRRSAIGPGDEVVTTPYTFYATAEAIARVGATPVFADIEPDTLNLDPAAAEAAITERTRAIMVVHVFGQPADLAAFRELADRHGLALIEDAAQAFGAACEGRAAGSVGDVATFSFFPTKNLPAMGDAGLVVTSSDELAERVRLLRFHGSRDKRTFEYVGRQLPPGRDAGRDPAPLPAAGRRAGTTAAGRPPPATATLGLGELRELPAEAARRAPRLPPVRRAQRRAARRIARGLRDAGVGSCRVLRDAASPAAGVRRPRLPARAAFPRPSRPRARAWRCRCSRR